jgi:hypothetical protein
MPPHQDPQPYQPHPDPAPPAPGYNPHQRVGRDLTVTQPGERMICEIKRHPIGILGIYVGTGLLITLLAVLILGVAPSMMPDSASQIRQYGGLGLLGVTVVSALYALIATTIYWGNKWIVTSDSITQVEQTGLFTKQSSQLSLSSLEDITAEQNGLLTEMLNYGVLKAETAGHRSKFVFLYCPNPNFYAREILTAREAHEQHREAAAGPPSTNLAEGHDKAPDPQYPSPLPPGYPPTS